MRTIHKFPLENTLTELEMDANAGILHVGSQNALPMIWAGVDTEAPNVKRTFLAVGTGHPIPTGCFYVGTVFQGPFVWHIHECKPPADVVT